jgi:hypothetical protein
MLTILLVLNILWLFLRKKDGPYRHFLTILACAVILGVIALTYLIFSFTQAIGNMTATGFA